MLRIDETVGFLFPSSLCVPCEYNFIKLRPGVFYGMILFGLKFNVVNGVHIVDISPNTARPLQLSDSSKPLYSFPYSCFPFIIFFLNKKGLLVLTL